VILPPELVFRALTTVIALPLLPTACGMDLAKIAENELVVVFNNVVVPMLMDLLEPLLPTPTVILSLVFV